MGKLKLRPMAKPDNPIYNRSVMIGGRVMTKQQEPSDKGLESDQIERGVIKDQNCSQSTPANTPRVIDPKDQLFVSIDQMTESMSPAEKVKFLNKLCGFEPKSKK